MAYGVVLGSAEISAKGPIGGWLADQIERLTIDATGAVQGLRPDPLPRRNPAIPAPLGPSWAACAVSAIGAHSPPLPYWLSCSAAGDICAAVLL